MAAPTAPTATDLCTEGLKRAGYSNPSTAQLTRAASWLEEIKNDIWIIGKRLLPLQGEHVEVLTPGKSRYNFPSGFSSIASARVLYGDEVKTVAAGGASSVTLASDEAEGEDEIEGKEILIYSGTGAGGLAQVTSFNDDTKIATISPAWTTAPVLNDTYVIVDQYTPLDIEHLARFNELQVPYIGTMPVKLYPIGSENNYGYYHVYPVPDDDHYYAVHMVYYMNLLTLDLAGTRMSTLYQRWRNLWIQGVKARMFEDDDDSRAQTEMARYYNMVKDITSLETYGRTNKQHYTGIRA